MPDILEEYHSLPNSPLALIATKGSEALLDKVDKYISGWRGESKSDLVKFSDNYIKDTYEVKVSLPRFGSGEAKGTLTESVRGMDVYILCDCFNYGVTYEMYEREVPMSPDDHFCDLKRVIAAISGHATRITVIMPMLYEGRQHKRAVRESLDCAIALQELKNLGVENIVTFDAHDPRVQNSIPLSSFENVRTSYQMIKALINNVPDIKIDKDNLVIISPDEGGMGRCIYYATVLGLNVGMFYKRRDYTKIVNGRNAIISHEYLGDSVEGKDVIIVDDMISSGDSMIDVASQLRKLKAKRVFICSSFGLFCNGLERFDKAYEEGLIEKVLTTNCIYITEELRSRDWFIEVDMSKYIAHVINTLNHNISIAPILNTTERIHAFLAKKGYEIKSDNK